MSMWYLEGDFNQNGRHTQQHLHPLPITLGRDENIEFTIPSPAVSRRHAMIEDGDPGTLIISDLDSSNGTYVNREKITLPTVINHGDIIHLGSLEMRLIDRSHFTSELNKPEGGNTTTVISLSEMNLSKKIPSGVNELEEILDKNLLEMLYQPIVRAKSNTICGYEIQGRSTSRKLATSTSELYRIAESVGLEVQLSTLIRDTGVDEANQHKLQGMLLVSTHPKELEDCDQLLRSITALRKRHPKSLLMLEISEQAATDLDQLVELKNSLQKLSIRYAFDDFGAGQSRFIELVNAQPHLIKFNHSFIEGIDKADSTQLSMLMHLHQMVGELRIKTLAACVNSRDEYLACQPIGFDMYQGAYFGEPKTAKKLK